MEENICQIQVIRAFFLREKGLVTIGKVLKGNVKVGDVLELNIPGEESYSVTCRAIEINCKLCDAAKSGDEVGILLGQVEFSLALAEKRFEGIFLNTPKSAKLSHSFTAECQFCTEKVVAELQTQGKIRVRCLLFDKSWLCEVSVPQKGIKKLAENKQVSCQVNLIFAMQINPQMEFKIHDGKIVAGTGKIVNVSYL